MKGVCLILGVGPGIGRSCALAFAREGYDLALASRTPQQLQGTINEIQANFGVRAAAFEADATDESSIARLVAETTRELGPIEVAIYNVASFDKGKPSEVGTDALINDFRLNVVGAQLLAKQVAPAMKAAQRGTLIFTGGGFAYAPAAMYSSLALGKAALRNLTFSLAQELGQFGIHVATVTVFGFTQPGTHFDPSRIAESYVKLHRQPKGKFETELVYK